MKKVKSIGIKCDNSTKAHSVYMTRLSKKGENPLQQSALKKVKLLSIKCDDATKAQSLLMKSGVDPLQLNYLMLNGKSNSRTLFDM